VRLPPRGPLPRLRPRGGDDEIGEIWVAGPGIALGYWRNDEETERTFGGRIEGESAPYLRTGEIFVTRRLKDLIIVRGRNIDPLDVELTAASCHAALRAGEGAAFGV
jgi:acyl-CoA synthetase (AMP-forming)/AMP-acid ligase II